MKKTAIAFCMLMAVGAAHAESARTVRATELYADSQSDASILMTLPENASLEVLQRRGAWSQVKTSAQTGWVRMLNLRFDAKGGASSLGNIQTNLATSGRTSNSGTDTTGVRGLTEADLNKAQPNPAEFKKMQSYASDKNTAATFGRRSKLLASKQPYLSNSGGY